MSIAYVDTNVLLRFLTGDPPDLAAQARLLFEAVEQGEITLILDDIVVAEAVWVLESFYKYPKHQVGQTLRELLSHEGLRADDKPGLLAALSLFADKNVDFADALMAVHMGQQGVELVFSFNRHFDHLPGIVRRLPGEGW